MDSTRDNSALSTISSITKNNNNNDDDDDDDDSQAQYSSALVVRMPGSMHYHTDFSVSAPLFRAAYAHHQVRPLRTRLGSERDRGFVPQG
jgi:hypothetical protein